MDVLTGALLAAAVGWASVLAAIALPLDRLARPEHLRVAGALTLALIAAGALGASYPAWLPLAFLAGGIGVAAWTRKRAAPE